MIKELLFISISCIGSCVSNAQLIQNGNFELSDSSNTTFKNWECNDSGYSISKDKNSVNNGRCVLKLQKKGNGNHAAFSQTIHYQPAQLEKYMFSGYVKTANVNSGVASLWLRVSDDSGYRLFMLDRRKIEISGTTEWKKVSVEILIPSLAKTIELGGLLIGDGTAWFDNLRLEKIKTGKTEQSEVAKKYLSDALDTITRYSIRKDFVDFKKLRADAFSSAADAKTTSDCYAAIRCTLFSLGDHHSLFTTPEETRAYDTYGDTKVSMPVCKLIDNIIGYITVPPFMSSNNKMQKQFADSMQHLIKMTDGKNIIGWIVDVRNNTGGNCRPMITGIGPVLGEGIYGYSIDVNGKKDSTGYVNGRLFENADTISKIDKPYTLINRNPYVAVLTNGNCGSSGESVVLAFKNRPKTKSFGAPTAGLTSGNDLYLLSDSATIVLTTGWGGDRLGNIYTSKMIPDVLVENNENTENDEVIDVAVKWLKVRR